MDREFRIGHRPMAVTIAVAAVVYLFIALRIPDFALGNVTVQPGTLPSMLGFLLLGLAAVLFFQPDPANAQSQPTPVDAPPVAVAPERPATPWPGAPAAAGAPAEPAAVDRGTPGGGIRGRLRDSRLDLGLVLLSMVAYATLLEPVGFALSTVVYVAGMAWYFGYRRHLVNLATSVGISLGLQFGLTAGLDIALPSGILPW